MARPRPKTPVSTFQGRRRRGGAPVGPEPFLAFESANSGGIGIPARSQNALYGPRSRSKFQRSGRKRRIRARKAKSRPHTPAGASRAIPPRPGYLNTPCRPRTCSTSRAASMGAGARRPRRRGVYGNTDLFATSHFNVRPGQSRVRWPECLGAVIDAMPIGIPEDQFSRRGVPVGSIPRPIP